MRTDTIFYQLFLLFPNLLFEILGEKPLEGYQFSSREIKELARRFDGIFLPPEEDIDKPIYFIEVQFQEKLDFWWRFLAEIFVYLGQYQPQQNWLAVALFSTRSLDVGLPRQFHYLLEVGQIKVFYLDELEVTEESPIELDIISLIVGKDSDAILKAQKTVAKSQEIIDTPNEQEKILQLIQTVLVYKLKNLTRESIEKMFTLDDLRKTRYFQDVKQEGIQEGIEKEINLVIRQLKRKLGNLSPELEVKVRNLSLTSLEDLGEALLDFSSLQDLISWLNSH
ncbi:Rpn family recombination-promoting nuclease/putative transposase [Geminocystis sp. GBBB08]|uniref:Rpn family recombination-promoting nuclease/putative transposase n=1 Tax=Geminocystis sp. GBBB08 TaxID=2604140 RepID=UPI0027E2C81A|nr:Rpn family recombination-promoting nuclease/putative transposase [Geminocystis sp. GBBB08]MBL1211535.1 Rpn family recombination-promoting nuclease/putative transposase [Geminocystis sp. GBBB08]